MWQPIHTAPNQDIEVIVACPSMHKAGEWIVGAAHRNPETGEWWWANTDVGDYYASPIHETNNPPTHWQPLPDPPHVVPTVPGNPPDSYIDA